MIEHSMVLHLVVNLLYSSGKHFNLACKTLNGLAMMCILNSFGIQLLMPFNNANIILQVFNLGLNLLDPSVGFIQASFVLMSLF